MAQPGHGCTYQAISGAGKTRRLAGDGGQRDPYIGGEDEKSEREPLKIFGKVAGGIQLAQEPVISAQCLRVASPTATWPPSACSLRKSPP